MLRPTCDPYVLIEEIYHGYVRYRQYKHPVDNMPLEENEINQRWEVHGVCTGIGKCYEGAQNPKPTLDCPVAPGFKDDCCPLKIVKL